MNFLKRQKLKIKLTKSGCRNQILRQFFAEELLVMFLSRLQKIVQKFKSNELNMNFLKRQKLKIKLTKSRCRNQILRQFFAEELLVMFLTRLQKIVQKLKSLSIN